MVSAPPSRADDNPFEETFAIGVGFNAGVVGEREVYLSTCRRRQRPERHRRTSAQGLVRRRVGAFAKLVGASGFESVAVEVDGSMVREAPIEDSIAEVLQGIEAAPPRRCQPPQIITFELPLKRFLSVGEAGRDLELSGTKRLRQKETEDRHRVDLRLDCHLVTIAGNRVVVELLEP
jgi:hypothetical protein